MEEAFDLLSKFLPEADETQDDRYPEEEGRESKVSMYIVSALIEHLL